METEKRSKFDMVLRQVQAAELSGFALRQLAMEHLLALPGYDWAGVYRLVGAELLLDAWVGSPTDHDRIPVGVGVCGTAVAEDKNQVIGDVRLLTNYLSCSAQTRSEIVVLIRRDGLVLGQIDIDGHAVDTFDHEDEQFLNALGAILAARWDT